MAETGLATWITVGATMLAAGFQAYVAGKAKKKKEREKNEREEAAKTRAMAEESVE